jgi:hypothetical protein
MRAGGPETLRRLHTLIAAFVSFGDRSSVAQRPPSVSRCWPHLDTRIAPLDQDQPGVAISLRLPHRQQYSPSTRHTEAVEHISCGRATTDHHRIDVPRRGEALDLDGDHVAARIDVPLGVGIRFDLEQRGAQALLRGVGPVSRKKQAPKEYPVEPELANILRAGTRT